MEPTNQMRSFHSMIRTLMIDDIKDPEMIEKLWGLQYISGLPLGIQNVEIPSNFLLPRLEPRNVSVLDEEKENSSLKQDHSEDN